MEHRLSLQCLTELFISAFSAFEVLLMLAATMVD